MASQFPNHDIQVQRFTGKAVVIKHFADRIRIAEVINNLVSWDREQCKIPPGERAVALIINILAGTGSLHSVEQFMEDLDVDVVFGPHRQAADYNDDSIARGLDKVHDADPKRIVGTCGVHALELLDLMPEHLHTDTTTVSHTGCHQEETVLLRFGHSKDNRPEDKQFKIGACVTPEGIPIMADIFAGNETDQKWNGKMMDLVEKYIPDRFLREIIHVADAALITLENLVNLDRHQYQFVSRCPDTFAVVAEVKKLGWETGDWTQVGTLSSGTKAASYRVQSFVRTIGGRSYALIAVHSDKLEAAKWATIQRHREKDRKRIERIQAQLKKPQYATRETAQEAMWHFSDQVRSPYWMNQFDIVPEPVRREKRGRPQQDEERGIVYRLGLESKPVIEEKLRQMAREEGTFVLISNARGKTPEEILRIYKGQPAVEQLFRAAKSEYEIAPLFFQREDRIEAFAYVFLLALLVYKVIENWIRKAAEKTGEGLLHAPGKNPKPDMKPTARKLFEVVAGIVTMQVHDPSGEHPPRKQLGRLTWRQEAALRLLGIQPSAFTTPATC